MSDGFFVRQGRCAQLNITAPVVLQTTETPSFMGNLPGRLMRVNVVVAGSAPGAINDAATVAAIAAANLVFVIPNTVGSYLVDWPLSAGLAVTPGTGQTLAVSYD